jgi:POT family proton-dependent oligopeptide transporter
MALGHFMMAFEPLFFPAMAVIAIGNGLFLPNLPSQVNLLYAKDDPRAGTAFNVYYVGINLGAFLAPLICGTLGELYGWHYGFGAAGIGMCLGLVVYTWGGRYLPAEVSKAPGRADMVQTGEDRGTIGLLVGVALAVMLFRIAYEQTGNTFAIWADAAVDRQAFGMRIPVTWFQSLNPMFVFLLSPLLVQMWNARAARGRAVPALERMTQGAIGVGTAYAVLAALIYASGAAGFSIGWLWLVAFFAIFTLAELYILPVGLGLFASLAPKRFAATTIAAWFFCSFTGNLLSGVIGAVWEEMSPWAFFLLMAAICIVSGLLLLAIHRVHQARYAAHTAAPQAERAM